MKDNIKIALSCWVRYILCALMAFFIYLSLSVLTVGAFTQVNGYEMRDAQTGETLYTHYYADGEDTKAAEYQQQGIELVQVTVREELSGAPKVATVLIAQIITGVITASFIYKRLWSLGDSDANLVKFNHKEHNSLRGLAIGSLAVVPNLITWLMLVISKTGLITDRVVYIFRFANYQMFALVNAVFGETTVSTSAVGWERIFLGLTVFLFVPIVAHIAYTLGYKRISLSEILIYKKKD